MSPSSFWQTFFRGYTQFIEGLGVIYRLVISTIMSNPILLIIYAFIILGFVIKVFRYIQS